MGSLTRLITVVFRLHLGGVSQLALGLSHARTQETLG